MIADVLIDTNILAYAYQPQTGEKHAQAIKILDYWIRTKRAAISSQVLGEFAVVATRKIAPPLSVNELSSSIENLIRSFIVLPVTNFVVCEAVRGMQVHQLSYWDAQIWAVAHLNQIPLILTEDLPGKPFIEGVSFNNPLAKS
ncbi:MAG: PIN domain-containing protein [Bacillota bacterium]|nr:PIN domain-containing protein [Bacillota bacterium]HHU60943.1 PIN domain-containing protein [Natronincola sp.]